MPRKWTRAWSCHRHSSYFGTLIFWWCTSMLFFFFFVVVAKMELKSRSLVLIDYYRFSHKILACMRFCGLSCNPTLLSLKTQQVLTKSSSSFFRVDVNLLGVSLISFRKHNQLRRYVYYCTFLKLLKTVFIIPRCMCNTMGFVA